MDQDDIEAAHRDGRSRNLKDYYYLFLRRLWLLPVTLLAGLGVAYYVVSASPDEYTSVATIEVERQSNGGAEIGDSEELRMGGQSVISTVVQKLQMGDLFRSVAERPDVRSLDAIIPKSKNWTPWVEKEAESEEAASVEQVTSIVQQSIGVAARDATNLIDIVVTHSDPEAAQAIAIGLLSEYHRMQRDIAAGKTSDAVDYIKTETESIMEEVERARDALNTYKQLLTLKEDIRGVETSIAVLEKKYLPRWPELVEQVELLSILQRRFLEEYDRVLRRSPSEKEFWQGKESVELAGLEGNERIQFLLTLVEGRADILENNLANRQAFLNNRINISAEGEFAQDFETQEFAITNRPQLPTAPSGPDRLQMMTMGGVGGLALGAGLILLLGFLDSSVRRVDELESVSNLSVLGAIPSSKDADVRQLSDGEQRKKRADFAPALVTSHSQRAASLEAEAIRSLRVSLSYLGDMEDRKTFLVSSSNPGEGKSWVSANIAAAFALQGDKTVLVDMDLRRPVQHQMWGIGRDVKGISEFLSQGSKLSEVTHETEVENLSIIPSGAPTPNPAELLGVRKVQDFFKQLRDNYDRVIIDSAPIIVVSDSLHIARFAQTVVLVYFMGKTPIKALMRSIKILESNKTRPAGVIANRLPPTNNAGKYGYYYGYYGPGGQSDYYSQKMD
ncbi:MAG: polysaccharide biosynthesis tyrosine autokinase [Verrucomicrobiota bacterium]